MLVFLHGKVRVYGQLYLMRTIISAEEEYRIVDKGEGLNGERRFDKKTDKG